MDESLFRGKGGLVAIVALALLVVVLGLLTTDSGDEDVPGSTFNDLPDGAAAYRELLVRLDRDVEQLRVPVAEEAPPPGSTLILLDVISFPPGEAEAVLEFAASGGRVVAAGPGTESLAVGLDRSGSGLGGRATVLFPHPALSGIEAVSVGTTAVWSDTGETVPLLGGSAGVALSWTRVGLGEMFLLPAGAPFDNDNLDEADNALLAARLAGDGDPILFAEYVHGFTRPTGLAAIPDNWRWALGLAGLAGVVWILAHARRLGPPESVERPLPPPRSRYVDSLATLLWRTRAPGDAVEPVRRTIRSRLARRGWDEPDVETRSRLAAHIGVSEEDLEIALSPADDDRALLAVGRVLAATHPRSDARDEP